MNTESSPSAEEIIVHSDGRKETPELRFLHYNDVYHIDASSREPVGGIARFKTLCNHYRFDPTFEGQPHLITLFSGDAFNPSLESTVTKGSHMVPVLNQMRTDCACVGNHDLDFGIPQFERLASKCIFPWLLANVLDPSLAVDVPLGHARKTVLLTATNGLKVGVIGLVEREWLDTINSLPPDLQYYSASGTAKRLVPGLRKQGADIIIAVTHAREPNDIKLASKTPPGLIDIILGGHDHFYGHSIVNGTHILRSGTDFKNLSYIKAWKKRLDGQQRSGWDFEIIRRDVVRSVPEDPEAAALVEKISSGLRSRLEKVVGYTSVALDARFTTVRLRESNMGNFVCDLMRLYYQADCAIMASGTIRGDQVYPAGPIRAKDIMDCFPFEDPVVVLRLSGRDILSALENSVCTYPALEGRFSQVSNIHFTFDPSLRPHQRITTARIGGMPIDPVKSYSLATRDYMARGKDGFHSLMPVSIGGAAEEIVSEENGMLISMLLRQYFMSLKTVGLWLGHGQNQQPQRQEVEPRRRKDSLIDHFEQNVHTDVHTTQSSTTEGSGSTSIDNSAPALQQSHIDSDSNSDMEDHVATSHDKPQSAVTPVTTTTPDTTAHDRAQHVKRRFLRKWWRLAGLESKGSPECASEDGRLGLGKGMQAIAPRVEGRIVIVGAA